MFYYHVSSVDAPALPCHEWIVDLLPSHLYIRGKGFQWKLDLVFSLRPLEREVNLRKIEGLFPSLSFLFPFKLTVKSLTFISSHRQTKSFNFKINIQPPSGRHFCAPI